MQIMTRVVKRPAALLDGSRDATKLVLPGSDAERYFDNGRVFEKAEDFIGYIVMLQTPKMPRMPGVTRNIKVGHQVMIAIQGEDVPANDPEVMYAFSLGPDSGEFIEMRRVVGEESSVLSWADVRDPANPLFRKPDLTGFIDEPAKIAELTQILAAAQDATEWALD
jgi:hypothetical protein